MSETSINPSSGKIDIKFAGFESMANRSCRGGCIAVGYK